MTREMAGAENTDRAKSSSSLIVAERRSQRDGGCAGIFSQLMDWKRKFAKKLFFSRKVLPPARSKQISKKLGGRGKPPKPKLLLIADENRGGFSKKGGEKRLQKHDMHSASLVARLMGLESMPVLHQVNSKIKGRSGRDDKFVRELNEDIIKNNELSPHNVQKVGISAKPPFSKFNSDALHLRGILRKSRTELSSPASPRRPSGRRTSSRLIGAAARILEPGMQAKKNAITYSNYYPGIQAEFMTTDENPVPIPEHLSCKTCGNVLGVRRLEFDVEKEQTSSSCSSSTESAGQELDSVFLCEAVAVGEEQISVNPRNFQHASSSSIDFQHRTRPQIMVDSNRRPISKICKEKKAMNRKQSIPSKQHRSLVEIEKSCIKEDESYKALARKRRIATIDKQIVNHIPLSSDYKHGRNSWLARDENDRNVHFLKQLPQVKNGLGELLEQKLKMLSHQELTELGESPLQRSSAIILQELISALCEEIPISEDNKIAPNKDVFQTEADTNSFANQIRSRNNDHILSPESVLGASFSNDSCFSSSSSGTRPHFMEPSFDLLESASSLDKTGTGFQITTRILSEISKINASLTASNLHFAKEIILTSELLFGTKDLLIFPLLIYEFESVLHSSSSRNQMIEVRPFAVDCVVEYLDWKCALFFCRCWRRLELELDFGREIGRWIGRDVDEMLEGEICGMEGFEIGCVIGGDLVMTLVDEIVVDLCKSWLCIS